MSALSALNNIQNPFASLTSSNATNKESAVSQNVFEEALNSAITDQGITLPSAAKLAASSDLETQSQETSKSISTKDSIESVFSGLGIGIASSLFAALSGDDSATAVTPAAGTEEVAATDADTDETAEVDALAETDEATDTDETADADADTTADTDETADTGNAEDTEEEKEATLFGTVGSFMPGSKAVSLAASSLSSIESLFLGDDDEKEEAKA
ncbi:MAG: hypothetical protein V5786_04085 [Psychromonas sp.]